MLLDRDDALIEASPLPSFTTAVGFLAKAGFVEVPPEVRQAFRGETLYLRAIDLRSARVLEAYRLQMT